MGVTLTCFKSQFQHELQKANARLWFLLPHDKYEAARKAINEANSNELRLPPLPLNNVNPILFSDSYIDLTFSYLKQAGLNSDLLPMLEMRNEFQITGFEVNPPKPKDDPSAVDITHMNSTSLHDSGITLKPTNNDVASISSYSQLNRPNSNGASRSTDKPEKNAEATFNFFNPVIVTLNGEDNYLQGTFRKSLSETIAEAASVIVINKLLGLKNLFESKKTRPREFKEEMTDLYDKATLWLNSRNFSESENTPLYKLELMLIKIENVQKKIFGPSEYCTYMSHPSEGQKLLKDLPIDWFRHLPDLEKHKTLMYYKEVTEPVLNRAFENKLPHPEIHTLLEKLWK